MLFRTLRSPVALLASGSLALAAAAAGPAALAANSANKPAKVQKADKAPAKKDDKAPAGQTYVVDPAASSLEWTARKVTGSHNGVVKIKEGTVTVADGMLSGGTVVADMTTIRVDDLKDAEYNKKLTDHLRSEDFFNVEKFNTATFKINSVKKLDKPNDKGMTHEISGDLTIKGITHPAVVPAKMTIEGDKANAEAHLVVDRTKYDIKYRSGKFFSGLGDKVIHDEFNLDLKLSAKK